MIANWVKADLDIRDQWAGIKRQRTEYKPKSFERKDKDGKDIKQYNKRKQQQNTSALNNGETRQGTRNTDNISDRTLGKSTVYNTD